MSRSTGTIGWRCRRCGEINGIEARYCRGCGAAATSGTPVDTSQRHTESHSHRYFGTDPQSQQANIPRDIGTAQKNGGGTKGVLIAVIVFLTILILGLGTFILIRILPGNSDGGSAGNKLASEQSENGGSSIGDYNDSNNSINYNTGSSGNQNDSSKDENETTTTSSSDDSYYIVGQEYYVQSPEGLRVRSTPSTESDDTILKRIDLKDEDIDKSKPGEYAVLKPGSKVTCLEMKGNWMKIASGWICVKLGSEVLVK